MARKICCPNCKSTDLQYTSINETNVTSKGGGYGVGKGCLGYLLLGPLGLLCGACGSKTKITTANTEKSGWVCKSCGHKFCDYDTLDAEVRAAEEQLQRDKTIAPVIGILTSLVCIIIILMCSINNHPISTIFGLIICLLLYKFILKNNSKVREEEIEALKRKRDYIRDNAYYEE